MITKKEKKLGLKRLPEKVERKRDDYVVSAKAVVLIEDKILLLRNGNGKWDLPGGKLDEGETILEGLHREIAEETGLTVEPLGHLGNSIRRYKSRKDVFVTTFLCEAEFSKKRKKKIRLSKEHEGFTLVSPKKARKLKFAKKDYRDALAAAHETVDADDLTPA